MCRYHMHGDSYPSIYVLYVDIICNVSSNSYAHAYVTIDRFVEPNEHKSSVTTLAIDRLPVWV